MKLFKIVLLLSGMLFFLFANCSSPSSSSDKTVITFANIWLSDAEDNDGDGYNSYLRLNFDVNCNKSNLDINIKVGVRYTDPLDTATYYIYFESVNYTIHSDSQDDAVYISLGAPNMELFHGSYDFLIQVYLSSNTDFIAAEESATTNSVLSGIKLETSQEDEPGIMNILSDSLEFGSDEDNLVLTIRNDGAGDLEWTASENISWLSVSPTSGTVSSSQQQQVNVSVSRTGLAPGNYEGILTIIPNVGDSKLIKVKMTVFEPSPFTFIVENQIFTPISYTVTGHSTKSIDPGDTVHFYFPDNPGIVYFDGSTSGKTTQGTQVGLLLTWSGSRNVTDLDSYTLSLIIQSNLFFLYITNNGSIDLGPLYVNYGLSDQTYDDIVIDNDGIKKSIGYYYAHNNTEIRTYWPDGQTYSYWIQGSNFYLPFTNNQSVNLINNALSNFQKSDPLVNKSINPLIVEKAVSFPSERKILISNELLENNNIMYERNTGVKTQGIIIHFGKKKFGKVKN